MLYMPSRKTFKKQTHNANRTSKFNTELCNNEMTFQECELAILRHSVDESEKQMGQKAANSEDVIKIIKIVEDFLIKKKLVCYGGTAINNILPKNAQFYDKNVEIPDYDFFSPNALSDSKELADIYYQYGYEEVEAKAGMHEGTYKVFVNFIPVADITYLHPTLYTALKTDSINISGIRYAPANYLRMAMFLELSRPQGDVSRWEKVLKRMNLLNKYYPLKPHQKCNALEIQRKSKRHTPVSEKLYFVTRDSLIDQGVVFFGGYAASLYSRYMSADQQRLVKRSPDFDVLSENPEQCAKIVSDNLRENGFKNIRLIQHTSLGEVVPEHIEIQVEGETVAFIYMPVACHSYNTITIQNKEVNIATIDTMLSFYLAFLYANKKYYDKTRILCLSMFLFQIEQQNRLEQRGLLKRFSTKCYGKQETLESIRAKKAQRYNELSTNRKSVEYEAVFLKYNPKTNSNLVRHSEKSQIKPHIPIDQTREIQISDTPSLSENKSMRSITRSIRTTPTPKNKSKSRSLKSKSKSKSKSHSPESESYFEPTPESTPEPTPESTPSPYLEKQKEMPKRSWLDSLRSE